MPVTVDLTYEQARLLERVHACQRLADMRSPGDPIEDDTHVYFFQRGDNGPVKIGRTVNVIRRYREVQTGCAEPLRIIAVAVMGGSALERRLHDLFAPDRLEGEWFQPSTLLYEIAGDL